MRDEDGEATVRRGQVGSHLRGDRFTEVSSESCPYHSDVVPQSGAYSYYWIDKDFGA